MVYEAEWTTVIRYTVGQNYPFFANIVMLITIFVTLALFLSYHVYLIKINLTTNENIKKGRMMKYMDLIKQTLEKLSYERKISIPKTLNQLTIDEIKKFKDLTFNSKIILISFKDPEFSLTQLDNEEVFKFYRFCDDSKIMYTQNIYHKGFLGHLKEIFIDN